MILDYEFRLSVGTLGFVIWICISAAVPDARACTVAAFGPSSTSDGRPILWKNRDVDNADQEMLWFNGGRFRFVANAYADETDKAWAGINEAGFAIMNSDSYNIGGKDGDDGAVMKLALENCATVDEFALLLDSLNTIGREVESNFGVFDSTGMTSIFEAANTWYVRYDACDDSLGLLVRANYSMCGDTNRLTGKERYDRAMQLIGRRLAADSGISTEFIIRVLARDIGAVGFDPYPLPFEGVYENLPYGHLPANKTICRTATRSVEIMVGPKPSEPAGTGMMWAILGGPDVGLPVPLWVQGGPVPEPLNGPARSRICDEAKTLREFIFPSPEHPNAVNTFLMCGVGRLLAPAESAIFELTTQHEAEWGRTGPDSTQARVFSEEMCWKVLTAYGGFWAWFDRKRRTALPDSGWATVPTLTRNQLHIRLPPNSRRVQIVDVQGRTVATISSARGAVIHWDAADLPVGGYFIRLPDQPAIRPSRFVRIP